MIQVFFHPDALAYSYTEMVASMQGNPLPAYDQQPLIHVANVDTTELGKAWTWMQNVDRRPWKLHPKITVIPHIPEECFRSLSAGDVLELEGVRYLIKGNGYAILPTPKQL